MPRLLLAIETSGPQGSLALDRHGACVAVRTLALGRNHAQTLVPELQSLLKENAAAWSDVGVVAVSAGPGSFTGLRVGIVCAKVLAYTLGCKLVAVETLEAIAANSPADCRRVEVVQDAQRQELFHAVYEREDSGHWRRAGEVRIVAAAEWGQSLAPGSVVSGPGLERLAAPLPGECMMLERVCWTPTAEGVAGIGRRTAEAERFADPWTLEPRYLRRSAAEEQWERLGRA